MVDPPRQLVSHVTCQESYDLRYVSDGARRTSGDDRGGGPNTEHGDVREAFDDSSGPRERIRRWRRPLRLDSTVVAVLRLDSVVAWEE
uniref:Uncharacterized protein n=1 Tax=Oryza glumipatula TaxID=40148 RepID=A0A0D9YDW9_9ORYZ